MAFTYLKVKSAKCLYFRWSWSWSCYFGLGLGLVSSGLGLGLKNLVLFTSLMVVSGNITRQCAIHTPDKTDSWIVKHSSLTPLAKFDVSLGYEKLLREQVIYF